MNHRLPALFNSSPLLLMLYAAMILFLMPIDSWAAAHIDNDVMGTVLCRIYVIINGATGRVIGCFAVTFVSVGALFGKTSWSLVVIVVVSVAGALGAHHIVAMIVWSMGENIQGADICPDLY